MYCSIDNFLMLFTSPYKEDYLKKDKKYYWICYRKKLMKIWYMHVLSCYCTIFSGFVYNLGKCISVVLVSVHIFFKSHFNEIWCYLCTKMLSWSCKVIKITHWNISLWNNMLLHSYTLSQFSHSSLCYCSINAGAHLLNQSSKWKFEFTGQIKFYWSWAGAHSDNCSIAVDHGFESWSGQKWYLLLSLR
jgi:hypothetical protein